MIVNKQISPFIILTIENYMKGEIYKFLEQKIKDHLIFTFTSRILLIHHIKKSFLFQHFQGRVPGY